MDLTRRDFIKVTAAAAGALGAWWVSGPAQPEEPAVIMGIDPAKGGSYSVATWIQVRADTGGWVDISDYTRAITILPTEPSQGLAGYFTGTISRVHVFDRILTPAELMDLAAGLGVPDGR